MSRILEKLGIKQSKPGFSYLLFHFMRELHYYPLEEEYEITPISIEKKFLWFRYQKVVKYKLVKKGMATPQFNSLLHELQEQNKREMDELKKIRR